MNVLIASYSWLVFDPPILNLGRWLAYRGHTVRALGIGRAEDLPREQVSRGFELARVKGEAPIIPPAIALSAAYAIRVLAAARQFRPDCYIAGNWNSFLAIALTARVYPARIVYYQLEYTDRSAEAMKSYSWLARLLLSLEKRWIGKAEAVFSAEPSRSRLMRADYSLGYTPIAVFNAPFRRRGVMRCSGSEMPSVTNTLRAVYAGSISQKTLSAELIEAFVGMPSSISLDLYGPIDGTFRREFEVHLARARASGAAVAYRGAIEYQKVQTHLLEYQVGIVLYRGENPNQRYCSPAKLFEYFAAGLGVIVSDLQSLRDIIAKTGAGVCIASATPPGIRDAVRRLAAQPTVVLEMRRRAAEAHVSEFCFEHQIRSVVEAIEAHA